VSARGVVAVLACVLAVACGPLRSRPPRPGDVTQATQTLTDGLCETEYTLLRPRGGPFDRVRARRLAKCDVKGGGAPVVLYLPGMHMNADVPADGGAPDFRRPLAAAGVRVWSVDYRTHFVPADASPDALDDLIPWTQIVFAGDAEALAALSRTVDTGPLYLAGFSFGAGIAYRLATRDLKPAGLVVLDGVPPEPRDGAAGDGPAIDVGSTRLPFDARAKLLADVLADPGGPSPVPDYATAGAALADIVDSSKAFGGHGGLSGVKHGTTDVRALAALLSTYDRWWPRATLDAKPALPAPTRSMRVLAFASANMGAAWIQRVRDGARAFGGDGATVIELPGYGHVDVLIGKDAPRLVFDPIRRFVQGEAIGVQPGRSK
jgi:pimeloyl-ACP methyl ester carboxylesterase